MSDQKLKEETVEQEEQVQVEEGNQAQENGTEEHKAPVQGEDVKSDTEDKASQEELEADPSLEELQSQLKNVQQQAEEHYQKFLRAQADLDNVRRRTRKEKEEQAKYASLSVIEQLLPVLDNFERAIEASKGTQDMESFVKGVEIVFRQIEQVLSAEGLEEIASVGEVFDPTIHQAVMQVESEEFETGTVVEEVQKGYKLKEKVIRPAMVKVSS